MSDKVDDQKSPEGFKYLDQINGTASRLVGELGGMHTVLPSPMAPLRAANAEKRDERVQDVKAPMASYV